MFCDLVGSTGISAQLDAEEWRDLVGAYLDAASAAVERNADILEILIRQTPEYGNVNFILGQALRVLPEAKLPKPVRNLLHAAPRICISWLRCRMASLSCLHKHCHVLSTGDRVSANGMVRPCSCPASDKLARGAQTRSTQCPEQQHRMRSP